MENCHICEQPLVHDDGTLHQPEGVDVCANTSCRNYGNGNPKPPAAAPAPAAETPA